MFAKIRRILTQIFRLARLAITGPKAWGGVLIYGIVLALNFLGVWISIQLINWSKVFFDALENMDSTAALNQLGVFFLLSAFSAGSWLIADWLRKQLLIMWRGRLTARALNLWIDNKAYWMLRPDYGASPIENPDQRVAEDCRKFIHYFLGFTLDLISQIVALFSLAAMLWSLATFALQFTLFGIEINIPRYMFWLAPIYVIISTTITHFLGRPLKKFYFEREKVEADFRHSLIQLRDNADQIAQAGGEPGERRKIDRNFGHIVTNWKGLIRRELIHGVFNRPYLQTVLRVPMFFALPAYFAGQVTLGGLMQLASAFSQVTTTLSWFIFSYRDLAEFVAVTERLDGLFATASAPEPLAGAPHKVERQVSSDGVLGLAGVALSTPDGRSLAPTPDHTIQPGERVWIKGASGRGKTTLISALAGLWPWGEGNISMPTGRVVVLPAGAPVFSEDLFEAACYPDDPVDHDPDHIRKILTRLGLGARLEGTDMPTSGLSMGERQRLGLARAVLHQPDCLIMDEATSALDPNLEEDLLRWLDQELPDAMMLIVSHRKPAGLTPDKEITIGVEQIEGGGRA